MRRIATYLLFITLSAATFAQSDWAPIGTEWYFSLANGKINGFGYLHMLVTGDTVIHDTTCKVIATYTEGATTPYVDSLEFMFKQGDSLFRFFKPKGGFGLIYDFGAEQGDTVSIEALIPFPDHYGVEKLLFIIDTSYSININGDILTAQKLWRLFCDSCGYGDLSGLIVEDIGSIEGFFPIYGSTLADDFPGSLRCYYNPDLGTYSPAIDGHTGYYHFYRIPYGGPWPYPCDTVFSYADSSTTIHTPDWPELRWSLEPTQQILSLSLSQEPAHPIEIQLLGITGQLIQEEIWSIGTSSHQVSASSLPPGVYLVKLQSQIGKQAIIKLLVRE